MATTTIKSANDASVRLGSTPWGNLAALSYKLETNSAGAVLNSDASQSAVTASGDVIRVGIIPAGFKLVDYKSRIATAFKTGLTFKAGFAYVDGVDSAAVPQDDDYFAATGTASTAGVLRQATTVAPVTLPKDAYLIVTTEAQANDKAAAAEFTVFAVAEGTK